MKKEQLIVPVIFVASAFLLSSCMNTPSSDTKMVTTTNDTSMMKDDAMKKDDGVMVGGAMMIKSRDIVDNAVLASNVTTLVAAVQAAGLVETLKSPGPFTVFAPTNNAFNKLPDGTVDTLLKPENK